MMLLSTGWQRSVLGPLQFRAVPGPGQFAAISVSPGVSVYTPKIPIHIRRMMAWIDQTDPLVGAGGAASLTWQTLGGGATGPLIASASIGFYNGAAALETAVGGGLISPTAVGELDVVVFPAGFMTGNVAAGRPISVASNAGTITGSLYLSFEWRDLASPVTAP